MLQGFQNLNLYSVFSLAWVRMQTLIQWPWRKDWRVLAAASNQLAGDVTALSAEVLAGTAGSFLQTPGPCGNLITTMLGTQ